jgi:cyclopropane fatty-acyl-phospholipid synthase-like methyltransferase
MKEWFNDWFNSSEYLEVYKHRNEKDAENHIKFILSNIKLERKSKILDMACGAGRHSILLAKQGFNVTGIDLSENLLSEAKKNASEEKLTIKFIKSDIREFNTEDRFNLILNLFTSFGYFNKEEDNFLVLQKAFEFLEKSGFFILDFFNKNYLLKNLIPLTEEIQEDKKIIQKRFIRKGRVEKIIEIFTNEDKKEFSESVKLYSNQELVNMLLEIGFEVVSLFGDFDGSVFDIDNSPRFIAICKK